MVALTQFDWQHARYALLPTIAALMTMAIGLYTLRRRRAASGATLFILFLLSVFVWSSGYAAEIMVDSLAAKTFWARVQYLGIVATPVAWLIFALQYTGYGRWLTRRTVFALAVVPVITLVMVWTSDWHSLHWQTISLNTQTAPIPLFEATYGFWFWIHTGYAYLLLLATTVLLVGMLIRSPTPYRLQSFSLFAATLAPWAGNVAYLSGLDLLPGVDLTSFGFALAGPLVAWSLFGLRLLDIVPAARDVVIENLSDAVIVLDAQIRVVDINPAAEKLLSILASGVIGQSAERVFSEYPHLVKRYRHTLEAQDEFTVGVGKTQRHFELGISPLRNRRGQLMGRIIVLHDVTERERIEHALRESEEHYRDLFENASDLIQSVGPDGYLRYANRQWLNTMGYAADEIEGLHFEDVLRPDQVPHCRSLFERLAKGGSFTNVEVVFVTKTGQEVILEGNLNARMVEGRFEATRGIFRDITERRRAEETIRRYAAELEERNHELDAFSRTVAHDLKTPLSGILGYAELAEAASEDRLPPVAHDYLQSIRGLALRMSGMIDNLLLLAQLREADEVIVAVVMQPVVQAAIERLQDRIQKGGISVEVEGDLPSVMGHGPWLEGVFANLIDNAIKYIGKDNPSPTVTIQGTRKGNIVRYEVRDNGLGIAEEDQKRLFEMFVRFHPEQAAGIGLGLSIVHRIVTKLGGEVGVESTPGEGSIFWFALPAAKEEVSVGERSAGRG